MCIKNTKRTTKTVTNRIKITITSKEITDNIRPKNKSSKCIETSSTEIKTKPKAKKEEKIIPIEVSSPILLFLIINPRNKAITIAAGAPSSEMLNPKKTPTAIIGSVECAIASAINPIFLLIVKDPSTESIMPDKNAVIKARTIKSYFKGSIKNSIPILVTMASRSMLFKYLVM